MREIASVQLNEKCLGSQTKVGFEGGVGKIRHLPTSRMILYISTYGQAKFGDFGMKFFRVHPYVENLQCLTQLP